MLEAFKKKTDPNASMNNRKNLE